MLFIVGVPLATPSKQFLGTPLKYSETKIQTSWLFTSVAEGDKGGLGMTADSIKIAFWR